MLFPHRSLRLLAVVLCLLGGEYARAEYDLPAILSFEDAIAPATVSRGAALSLSDTHYKHGTHSLCYTWHKQETYLSIRQPIAYEQTKTVNTDNSVYSFVFWMYLEQPLQDSVLFEFRKGASPAALSAMPHRLQGGVVRGWLSVAICRVRPRKAWTNCVSTRR